ncbi:hypothetical protein VDG1235_429 [Verrucomicrobiia bacterium DG1235]|nr:hypothetical protein VDG1235_429 [Verrucomicrobiae bacterium DG1235]
MRSNGDEVLSEANQSLSLRHYFQENVIPPGGVFLYSATQR